MSSGARSSLRESTFMRSEMKKKTIKTPSLRAAINAMCKQCIYDPKGGEGTWRQQVEACPATTCPLYPVRPVSRPKKPSKETGGVAQ